MFLGIISPHAYRVHMLRVICTSVEWTHGFDRFKGDQRNYLETSFVAIETITRYPVPFDSRFHYDMDIE